MIFKNVHCMSLKHVYRGTLQLVRKISVIHSFTIHSCIIPPSHFPFPNLSSSPSTSLLHFFTVPLSPSVLPSLISHASSMPAVVLKAVSRRSVGQDLGRTSTVISLDISSHCKRNRKCMSHSKRLLVVDVVVVFCFFNLYCILIILIFF